MSTNVDRKCPICGKDMTFVGYTDKGTREPRENEFFTRGQFAPGALSGVLRKYRCLNGHIETNENEFEKKCSSCGRGMVFVGVIDKDTKEWRPLEGMPLSGTLRKYQCRHCEHVETNEGT